MSRANFEVGYDGPALRDGTMDVGDLAPALLSISRLLSDSNRVLNQDRTDVTVRVRAGTEAGSFPIELVLDLGLAEQISAALSDTQVIDAHQLLAVVGFLDPEGKTVTTIKNLIDLFKVLKGKKPVATEVLEDGNVKLTISGSDNEITVNQNTYNLYGNVSVRKDLEEIVRPVREGHVDEFQVRREGDVTRRIGREEAGYFSASTEDEVEIEEGEEVKWVTVRKHWYREDRKWKFHDGASSFNATVEDDQFWKKVHKDEITFSEHMQFKVRVRWRQTRTPEDVSMERRVVAVLDYKPAPVQGKLSLPDEPNSTDEA